ncbi:MAG: hypothetical protein KY445_07075 [Armatimonadetes bacterium]|nr:hypothetical protein [Armatimonadota bacterium]
MISKKERGFRRALYFAVDNLSLAEKGAKSLRLCQMGGNGGAGVGEVLPKHNVFRAGQKSRQLKVAQVEFASWVYRVGVWVGAAARFTVT